MKKQQSHQKGPLFDLSLVEARNILEESLQQKHRKNSLKEYKEYLDLSVYGYWVHPETNTRLTVPKEQHWDVMEHYIAGSNLDDETKDQALIDPVSWAFDNNWVRFATSKDEVEFEAKSTKALQTVLRRVVPQLIHMDISVIVEVTKPHKYHVIRLPAERSKLVSLMGNLTENHKLFEANDPIDWSQYGSWYNPKLRKHIPVGKQKHYEAILDYIDSLDNLNPRQRQELRFKPYTWAYDNGWIRMIHERPDLQLNFQANEDVLRANWPWILKIVRTVQPQMVGVDQADTGRSRVFHIPEQSTDLRGFNFFGTSHMPYYESRDLSEKLDLDLKQYGAWYLPDNNVILDVPRWDHLKVIRQYYENPMFDYLDAYFNGWIRLSYPNAGELNVEALEETLVKHWKKLLPVFFGMERVYIETYDTDVDARLQPKLMRDVMLDPNKALHLTPDMLK